MAGHNWVVKKIAKHHSDQGQLVYAEHCTAGKFSKPPPSFGARGRKYIPDVCVGNKNIVYEVEPYFTLKHSISQVKAFGNDCEIKKFIIVISSGTEDGIPKLEPLLERNNVKYCRLVNWRTLFNEFGI